VFADLESYGRNSVPIKNFSRDVNVLHKVKYWPVDNVDNSVLGRLICRLLNQALQKLANRTVSTAMAKRRFPPQLAPTSSTRRVRYTNVVDFNING
jgi:hypothetical protein